VFPVKYELRFYILEEAILHFQYQLHLLLAKMRAVSIYTRKIRGSTLEYILLPIMAVVFPGCSMSIQVPK
jgi:hypothetical protein